MENDSRFVEMSVLCQSVENDSRFVEMSFLKVWRMIQDLSRCPFAKCRVYVESLDRDHIETSRHICRDVLFQSVEIEREKIKTYRDFRA